MTKLNVACGPNLFPRPWINYDHVDLSEYVDYITRCAPHEGMPTEQQELCRRVQAGGGVDFRVHNVLERLPHGDNSVDRIYFGQAVEHFNPIHEVPRILAEFFRVLKPGGTLRITTPDLRYLLEAYEHGELEYLAKDQPDYFQGALPEDQLCYIMYGAGGAGSTSTSYEGHHHLYTQDSLRAVARRAGFETGPTDITRHCKQDAAPQPEERDCGMSHSFAIEAVKPNPRAET